VIIRFYFAMSSSFRFLFSILITSSLRLPTWL
jgi:hypothetical protein